MNSAAEVSTAESPEVILSKDEFWQEYKDRPGFYGRSGNILKAPDHYNDVNYKLAKFFGSGAENSFEAAYEAYLNNVNNRNEAKAVQSARAWDEFMSNTAYSRAFADLERSGINPYLLLNSGASPSTATGSVSKGSYSRDSTKEAKSNNKGRDLALIMLAIARIAATL